MSNPLIFNPLPVTTCKDYNWTIIRYFGRPFQKSVCLICRSKHNKKEKVYH